MRKCCLQERVLAQNPLREYQQPCLKPRMKRKGRPVTRRPEDSPGKMVTRDPRARKPSAQFQGLSHHTLHPMQGCWMAGLALDSGQDSGW